MSYGIESYGVGSYGTEESSGAPSPNVINCGYSPASAVGYAASVSSMPVVDLKIAFIGDSNGDGRLSNNQPFTGSGSYVYKHDGSVVAMADPVGAGPYTYTGLDDGGGTGSLFPRVAQAYYDSGRTILAVPCCKGGTQASNWTRSTLTSTQYGAMKSRIDEVGGVNKIVIFLGANDAIGGVSQSTFVSRINTLVSNLNSDFPSAEIYLNKVHDFTGHGTNVQVIRAGVQEVWENNAQVKRGADFDGITTSVHYTTDADAIAASSRQYAALEGVTIACGIGSASAVGYQASIVQGAYVDCAYSPASAIGYQVSISQNATIDCSFSAASAIGYSATITNGSSVVIDCQVGDASAIGYQSAIYQNQIVYCQQSNASALGYGAEIVIPSDVVIACQSAIALASGYTATIDSDGAYYTIDPAYNILYIDPSYWN